VKFTDAPSYSVSVLVGAKKRAGILGCGERFRKKSSGCLGKGIEPGKHEGHEEHEGPGGGFEQKRTKGAKSEARREPRSMRTPRPATQSAASAKKEPTL
jgi:hypothetical protein